MTYDLPSYLASALINEDSSSLDEKEITELKTWLAKENLGFNSFIDVSTNEFFSWSHDYDPAGGATCCTFTVITP